jgi:hypothetical protein
LLTCSITCSKSIRSCSFLVRRHGDAEPPNSPFRIFLSIFPHKNAPIPSTSIKNHRHDVLSLPDHARLKWRKGSTLPFGSLMISSIVRDL